ncbi:non-canonical purine NTP pyrophosphatase [Leucobacter chinensis]|uniref:non-canonical purine NTP pyrophosphatase n=1 Tax=Leucobacter chinensis TaxID=2851010 RepID=UPI001C2199A9
MIRVVLASHNRKKLEELRRIIGPKVPAIELVGYDGPEPVEDGTSFAENALIKARAAAAHTGLPAIADDSGIAVDILGGSPGIFSARWGGPARDDLANLELLKWQLSDVAHPHRGGAFMCAAALVLPSGDEVTRMGEWRGTILEQPRGANGFGYDPLFQPDGFDRSAAELTPAEKDAESHRTRAFTALVADLNRLAE